MAWREPARRGRRAGHVRKGSPGTWEASSPPPEKSSRNAERRKRARAGGEESERRSSSEEAGEPTQGTPWSKGRRRDIGTERRERWERHRAHKHLNETRTDSEAGEGSCPTCRSRRWPITSTSTGCARRTDVRARTAHGRGRADRGGVRGASGGQPPVAARTREVRHVPGAAGAAGPHPEGRRGADATHGHPDLRGQGPAARGRDGAGGRLRAGVSDCSYGFRPDARRIRHAKRCRARW